MNKVRRKAIKEIIDQLGTLKEQLESITEDEQKAYDNLPESIQYSKRGHAMNYALCDMGDATCSIEDAMSTLQNMIER